MGTQFLKKNYFSSEPWMCKELCHGLCTWMKCLLVVELKKSMFMNNHSSFFVFVTEHANVCQVIPSCRMHPSSCIQSSRQMTHNFQCVISTDPHDIGDEASKNVDSENTNMNLPEATSKTLLTGPTLWVRYIQHNPVELPFLLPQFHFIFHSPQLPVGKIQSQPNCIIS